MCQPQTAAHPPIEKVKAWLAKVCQHFGVESCVFDSTVRLQERLARSSSETTTMHSRMGQALQSPTSAIEALSLPTQFVLCLRVMIKYIDDWMAVTSICKAVGETRTPVEWSTLEFAACAAVNWDLRACTCNEPAEQTSSVVSVVIPPGVGTKPTPQTHCVSVDASPDSVATMPISVLASAQTSRIEKQTKVLTSKSRYAKQTRELILSSITSLLQTTGPSVAASSAQRPALVAPAENNTEIANSTKSVNSTEITSKPGKLLVSQMTQMTKTLANRRPHLVQQALCSIVSAASGM